MDLPGCELVPICRQWLNLLCQVRAMSPAAKACHSKAGTFVPMLVFSMRLMLTEIIIVNWGQHCDIHLQWWYPILVSVRILAPLLPPQLPANDLGKQWMMVQVLGPLRSYGRPERSSMLLEK